jgi:hypothetical protein
MNIHEESTPQFLDMPGIRIPGTGADTLNSVQASYLLLFISAKFFFCQNSNIFVL